jgi:Ca-activated chloride channel family protein
MTFLWPDALWLLATLPLLVGLYLALLRRRKKTALAYPNLALVRAAMGTRQSARRHVPPALFLAALALMIVAFARPAALVTLPSQHETVILPMT